MSTRPQELNKIIADLRQIIVGKVAMPTDQIEQITLFLFLKQLSKKHDELVRIRSKELIFTGAWERYHFDVLVRHSGEDLVKECREAVESLYKNSHIDPTVRKVFERSYLKILDPKVLSSFLIYLNDKFSDGLDLGDFYESLLPILGTQNELGQFRTPRHIIDFIIRVIDPSIGEKIADPACGTAGFLVSAFNYLKEKYTDKGRLTLNPEQIKQLYNDTIYGWDMEPLMVKFSLANLYLHGLKVPNVSENDTLLNENLWQHAFDIIVANPPFITPTGGARRHSRFSIASNKTEVLFSEWMVHHLNFNGRMGIIVPEGIIFDSSKGHQVVRKLFLDNGLWCVVSLPPAVFQPYSGVKTSIIFLDKTLKPENILFYKIDNHGFSLNTNPTPIDKNDLPEALKVLTNYKTKLQDNKQELISDDCYVAVSKIKILENPTISLNSGIYLERRTSNNIHSKMVELGEICEILDSKRKPVKGSERKKGKYPYYGATGIVDYVDQYLFDEKLVLVGEDGAKWESGNKTAFIADGQYWVNNHAHVLRPDRSKVIDEYIVAILTEMDLSPYVTGITVPKLNQENLKIIKIPLPPHEVQEQIVVELEGYQKVIDGAKQVVDSWKPIVIFDPEWKTKTIEEICTLVRGSSPRPQGDKRYYGGSVPRLMVSDVTRDGMYTTPNTDSLTEQGAKLSRPMKKGEVVMAVSGNPGLPTILAVDACIHDGFVGFRNLSSEILPQFFYFVLLYQKEANHFQSTGAVFKNLNTDQIKLFMIPIPPLDIQKKIVEKMEEEQKMVEGTRNLLKAYEQKIEAKVKSIWEG